MPLKSAPRQQSQRSIIYLTFVILLSIPLVVLGLTQDNFDIRNRAFDELELGGEHQCILSLPMVNPYTLEVGKTITIQIDALLEDDYITSLEIYNSEGRTLYKEIFENNPLEFSRTVPFTPTASGKVDLLGLITVGQGGTIPCEISSPYNIKGLTAVANNRSPEFLSSPSESRPSQNIQTGDIYEYTLKAADLDGDFINYSYSFTPRADWLTPTIIEDGSSGNLTIKFRGYTEKPASYLANVFIHDGYSKNIRSQSWVINVSPSENDIPIVKIIEPLRSTRVDAGDVVSVKWESVDLNELIYHDIYITNNPANETLWKLVAEKLPGSENSYSIDTTDMDPGTYKIIVKSTDNQEPPATGVGISQEIVISGDEMLPEEKDDTVKLSQPQVTNMSPTNSDVLSNRRTTIRATIIASEGADINESSIKFKLNDIDRSEKIRLNKISGSEYTVIFQPEEDLKDGVQKAEISFTDTDGLDVSKTWTFTMEGSVSSSDEYIAIFGYEISKSMLIIIVVGLATIILALAIPFIIFTIWKGDKRREEGESYQNDKLPPSVPKDNTSYIEPEEISTIEEIVNAPEEEVQVETEAEDMWDKYSAPKPEDIEKIEKTPSPVIEQTEEPEIILPEPAITVEENVVEESPSIPESQEATIQEPSIPEPDIPDAESLQKISEQIQQAREDN